MWNQFLTVRRSVFDSGADGQGASEAAAAAWKELDDPDEEDEWTVFLVGPGIINRIASKVGGLLVEGAELADVSETVDSGGNNAAEVGTAEAWCAPSTNESEDGLVGTDGNAAEVQHDEEEEKALEQEDVRPSGAS